MSSVSIVVPVYNEKEIIEVFVRRLEEALKRYPQLQECIFVDDHSTDGTVEILERLAKRYDFRFLYHTKNRGYGASLKTGIRAAQNNTICIIDSDNTYDPLDILKLIPFAGDYDMVVGSRNHFFHLFPLRQKIAKPLICALFSAAFRQKIDDINSGLRMMKKDVLKRYLPYLSESYSFTAGITLAMLLDRQKLKYVPVSYAERAGKTKVRLWNYSLVFMKSCLRVIRHHLKRRH